MKVKDISRLSIMSVALTFSVEMTLFLVDDVHSVLPNVDFIFYS